MSKPQLRLVARVLREVTVQLAVDELKHYDMPSLRRIRRRRARSIREAAALVHRIDAHLARRRAS